MIIKSTREAIRYAFREDFKFCTLDVNFQDIHAIEASFIEQGCHLAAFRYPT